MQDDDDDVGLLERGVELDGLARLLTRSASGRGAVAIVRAGPGLGKTSLLRWVRERAQRSGMHVADARGGQLESDFAFGVARQLFVPALRSGGDELQVDAVSAGVLLEAPKAQVGDRPPMALLAALAGLADLTRRLSLRAPLTLLVDDAHWADLPSLQFLDFLARRVERWPVLVVLTVRVGDALAPVPLEDMTADPAVTVYEPRPLSRSGVATAVRRRLSPQAEESFCSACYDATGGNPLYVGELLRSLSADGVAPSAASIPVVHAARPGGVRRHLQARLQRLTPPARRLATVLAVLGEGAEWVVAVRQASLDHDSSAAAGDELVRSGVLSQVRPPAFVHALLREAALELLPASERSTEHSRAALLLAEHGASPERVASHILLTSPRSRAEHVAVLVTAAAEARRRGTPTAAVVYLRRALVEPPPPEWVSEISRQLGNCEAYGLQFEAAAEHLRTAVDSATDSDERALAAFSLARFHNARGDAESAVRTLVSVSDPDAAHTGELMSIRIEAELAGMARVAMLTPLAERTTAALIAQEQAAARIWPPLSDLLHAHRSLQQLLDGAPAADAAASAQRSLAPGRLRPDGSALHIAVHTLLATDRLAVAEQHLELAVTRAAEQGLLIAVAIARGCQGRAALLRGDLPAAYEHVQAGLELTHGAHFALPMLHATLARLLLLRGEVDQAGEVIGRSALAGSAPPRSTLQHWLLESRAHWRAATGDLQGALEDLLLGLDTYERQGWGRVLDVPWRTGAARLARVSGQRDLARRLVAEHRERAVGLGTPRALAAGLREEAELTGGQERRTLLGEAVRLLEDSPARLDLAEALHAQGAALTADGELAAGRLALRRALHVAGECSAEAMVHALRGALAAGGGRPPRERLTGGHALTDAERQVAELVASGLTNRQVAERLVVTAKTVEAHLSRVYRKLGVSSRTQLAAGLHHPPPALEE